MVELLIEDVKHRDLEVEDAVLQAVVRRVDVGESVVVADHFRVGPSVLRIERFALVEVLIGGVAIQRHQRSF